MSLTVKDLEALQAKLGSDYRMELVDGKITVMSPSGYESDEVAFRFGRRLADWVEPNRLGRVTGSSAGFTLPDSNTRAPDVSFVRAERLRRAPRNFAPVAPDLMVEVKSPSDTVEELERKIANFLAQGTQVGILINPEDSTVRVFQSGKEPITLRNGDVLTLPDLLPGWSVAIAELWSPVFDEEP
ncbi:Uma2 family endonuclease [Thermoleptolyngbya sp. C42_A2020_037]|uniref:Uma2 family endonuclease n=1 Tax=Thermoleptolyngbya sp. C42_A2020_037 TaxID=2747799 RepID=UPI0019E211D6|nr:Uma2 family endonuclease [Thermoleptolyngbya sp. C42_A2020_037]MBF2084132.1 Uma2 family endonuclease [Thermoleptolyngbya sp. C42_A2020_037]